MTYTKYLERFPEEIVSQDGVKLRDLMAATVEVWSSEACRGYCILAMESAGFSRKQIAEVMGTMSDELNFVSPDDAAKVYEKF